MRSSNPVGPTIAFTSSGGDDTDVRDLVYSVCRPHIFYTTGEYPGLRRAACKRGRAPAQRRPWVLRDGLV